MISDAQIAEYMAHCLAAFDRGRADVSIDTLTLLHILQELSDRRKNIS